MMCIYCLLGCTIVLVIYDIDEVLRLVEYLVLMDYGEVVQQGNLLMMLICLVNDFVCQFFGCSELGVCLFLLCSVVDYVCCEE